MLRYSCAQINYTVKVGCFGGLGMYRINLGRMESAVTGRIRCPIRNFTALQPRAPSVPKPAG